MVRKIDGKGEGRPMLHLNHGGNIVRQPTDIVNALGETFTHNSSLAHYSNNIHAC